MRIMSAVLVFALAPALARADDAARVKQLMQAVVKDRDVTGMSDAMRGPAHRQLVAMGTRAVPHLFDFLFKGSGSESDEAYIVMARVGRPALRWVIPYLSSPNEHERDRAVYVVSAIRAPDLLERDLTRLARDEKAGQQKQAALGVAYQLGSWSGPVLSQLLLARKGAEGYLIVLLRSLRYVAAKASAPAFAGGTVDLLCALMGYPHHGVREAARMCLEDIGVPAISALTSLLARTDLVGPHRWNAALALGTILGEHAAARTPAALHAYDAQLSHADPRVRASAAEALAAWGLAGKATAVRLLDGERDAAVRQKMMQVASSRPPRRPDGL